VGINVEAGARDQRDNPLQKRAALVAGDVRGASPRDPIIWLRRWSVLQRSQALQYGLGGLAGLALSAVFVEGGSVRGLVVPTAAGAVLVSSVTAVIYRRLLHAEIVRFVTECGPVRRARILLHLTGIPPKNENLRGTLSKLVEAGRIQLENAHYGPVER
jgi:hypothetical protein